jgi:hypothetical protein
VVAGVTTHTQTTITTITRAPLTTNNHNTNNTNTHIQQHQRPTPTTPYTNMTNTNNTNNIMPFTLHSYPHCLTVTCLALAFCPALCLCPASLPHHRVAHTPITSCRAPACPAPSPSMAHAHDCTGFAQHRAHTPRAGRPVRGRQGLVGSNILDTGSWIWDFGCGLWVRGYPEPAPSFSSPISLNVLLNR